MARKSSAGAHQPKAAAYSLRDHRPADFDQLWRIDQQCFPSGIAYSREELAHYLDHPGAFTLVAESPEAGILGFLVAQKLKRGTGHIVTIDVLPEARGEGVGSQLLSAAEARLRAAGCRAVLLETAVDNDPAIRFYKRHDYFVVKIIPRYYMGKLDALLMAKKLD